MASVVTSMTAISMTAIDEVVTPAKLTEIKTSQATPTAVPDTKETIKANAVVNEGKTTLPATPIATKESKKPKKKKKKN